MPPSFVILIGQTGVGKSTLVNACIPNAGAPVSHTLASATQTVVAYSLKKDELILVDTPGLDSDKQTDAEILQLIVNWMASQAAAMAKQPSNKVVRCGVIIVQGGNAQNKPTPILLLLEKALQRKKALHRVTTKTEAWPVIFYNGSSFKPASAEAKAFCLKVVQDALNDAPTLSDLLKELQKVHSQANKQARKPPKGKPQIATTSRPQNGSARKSKGKSVAHSSRQPGNRANGPQQSRLGQKNAALPKEKAAKVGCLDACLVM